MNQMIAQAILTETGLEVEIADDGEVAVEKMKAAKQIRQMDDKSKAGIPIVAVTANAFEEDRKVSMEAGMNGHLAKPYDIPAMMETLNKLLNV